jgi:ABC-type sugar transport system substrate-binding protein
MAKGIGNGCPLAAVVTTKKIAQSLVGKIHFNTFGGNPVVTAMGKAVLEVIEKEKLQENAHRLGTRIKDGLEKLKAKYPIIGDVRGKGLLLGVEMVKAVSANSGKDSIGMVELGGTPGNGLSAGWQKCADEEASKHPAVKILGKADTNWTQEGAFQAMSGFLAQGEVDAVIYEYSDGFRGGLKAFQDAGTEPNIVVALRTDEQGLFCDWEKANDPDFKIFFAAGMNYQAAVALTAGMKKIAGENIPTVITPPFRMRPVTKGMCNPDLPDLASGTTMLDSDMLKAMYPK